MKILFVIKTLTVKGGGGGAERVLSAITAELSRRGHEVVVATFDGSGATTFYPFSSRVRLVRLAIGDAASETRLAEFVRRTLALRKLAVQFRPDAAVGFMHSSYISLALALVGSRIPAIGSAHSVYEHYRDRPIDRVGLRLAAALLRKLTAISERMRSGFPRFIARKMVIIANPTLAQGGLADVAGGDQKTLLCVGRLGPEKDHATLISAFAHLAERFPDWRLRIVGEGALRPALQRQVDSLSLGDRIELPGVVAQIGDEYAAAQLFVLPSRYESFGLVTAEAMVHGLPVIAFADCDGAREIVHHGVNGLLVADAGDRTASLTDAMARLMDSPNERKRLGDAGRAAKFDSIDDIVSKWEALLGAVATGTIAMGETKPRLGEAHRR